MKTLHIENTWVQKRVVPNLNVQIMYMDGPFLKTGEDQILIDDNNSNKPKENKPFFYYENGLVIFDTDNPVYCYFDNKIIPVMYSRSQEFTDRFNNANFVSVLVVPINGLGKIIRIK